MLRDENSKLFLVLLDCLVSSIYSLVLIGNLPFIATNVDKKPTQIRNTQMANDTIKKNQSPSPIEVKVEPTK